MATWDEINAENAPTIKFVVLKSTTKYWKVSVDDTGTLSAEEITG